MPVFRYLIMHNGDRETKSRPVTIRSTDPLSTASSNKSANIRRIILSVVSRREGRRTKILWRLGPRDTATSFQGIFSFLRHSVLGIPAFWSSQFPSLQHFGHPLFIILQLQGIPRYPPRIPKSRVFQSSPAKTFWISRPSTVAKQLSLQCQSSYRPNSQMAAKRNILLPLSSLASLPSLARTKYKRNVNLERG